MFTLFVDKDANVLASHHLSLMKTKKGETMKIKLSANSIVNISKEI